MKIRTKTSTYSGVLPLPIYTKPADCGGHCLYCFSSSNIPNGYLENEDTCYARSVNYSPDAQIKNFKQKCYNIFHQFPLPCEIIVLGGSFSNLEHDYRVNFIEHLYNELADEQGKILESKKWQKAKLRCSVLTVESRPDQITDAECKFLRSLGVTKVEIGVQHLDDDILDFNFRGHDSKTISKTTALLKKHGLKVGYHIMLGLPGSSIDRDINLVSKSLWQPNFAPDSLKIYPCVLLRNKQLQPRLWRLFDQGIWTPPDNQYINTVLESTQSNVPVYVRISRIQRQISPHLIAFPLTLGHTISAKNKCKCIRCREVGKSANNSILEEYSNVEFKSFDYGENTFFEFSTNRATILLAFARIYWPPNKNYALLREIRVCGDACAIGTKGRIQGNGLGTSLLKRIEGFVKHRLRQEIWVNSSVGAMSFFKMNGYFLNNDGFFSKNLKGNNYDRG